MSQCAINKNGTVLPWHTLSPLNDGDINRNTEEQERKYFDAKVKLKLVGSLSTPKEPIEEQETYAYYTKG